MIVLLASNHCGFPVCYLRSAAKAFPLRGGKIFFFLKIVTHKLVGVSS